MSTYVFFVIPGPPKGKGRARITRTGHAFTPKDTAMYENLVRHAFAEAYPNWRPMDSACSVKVTALFSIPKYLNKKATKDSLDHERVPCLSRPDGDNIMKIVCDSLNGRAWTDDAKIYAMSCHKLYSRIPRVEVLAIWDE